MICKCLTQACSSITFAFSQLLIKYLFLTANSTVAEQICMTTLTPNNIYLPVQYFYIGKMYIYSAAFAEIFIPIYSFS